MHAAVNNKRTTRQKWPAVHRLFTMAGRLLKVHDVCIDPRKPHQLAAVTST